MYEKISHDLTEDSAVLCAGRLSIREEEAPKLIVDAVEPLGEALKNMTEGEKRMASRRTGAEKPASSPDAAAARGADVKLFLRLHRPQMERLPQMLAGLEAGDVPLYLNLPEENVTLLAPRALWQQDADAARSRLILELGAQNVKIKRTDKAETERSK